jgi:hypothetical protein
VPQARQQFQCVTGDYKQFRATQTQHGLSCFVRIRVRRHFYRIGRTIAAIIAVVVILGAIVAISAKVNKLGSSID